MFQFMICIVYFFIYCIVLNAYIFWHIDAVTVVLYNTINTLSRMKDGIPASEVSSQLTVKNKIMFSCSVDF